MSSAVWEICLHGQTSAQLDLDVNSKGENHIESINKDLNAQVNQAVAAQLPLAPLATQPLPPTTSYYHLQTLYPPNYYPYYPLNCPPFVQNRHLPTPTVL